MSILGKLKILQIIQKQWDLLIILQVSKSITEKDTKLQRLMKTDAMDGDLIRYLPTMVELIYQDDLQY